LAGPAPSGDFWFLLVASKGTRRRQGIRGDLDLVFIMSIQLHEKAGQDKIPTRFWFSTKSHRRGGLL
ncbi:MAG: hypothetical protein OYM47_06060, partial [Gemmatimonadota bacterium]|nr:hypothetical protein [Gemmatimonadota bacterium]